MVVVPHFSAESDGGRIAVAVVNDRRTDGGVNAGELAAHRDTFTVHGSDRTLAMHGRERAFVRSITR
jgi:hypothetical protein